jgi:hypothetical protein
MSRLATGTLALAATLLFASALWADPTWSTGYPKSGDKAGEIAVAGAYGSPPAGTPSAIVMVWPTGKGVVQTFKLTIKPGACGGLEWSGKATGLVSGKTYNVMVRVTFTDGAAPSDYAADCAMAVAK